jgi:hypothetical protein
MRICELFNRNPHRNPSARIASPRREIPPEGALFACEKLPNSEDVRVCVEPIAVILPRFSFSLGALRINRKLMASRAIRRVSNQHQGITISGPWWMTMLWIFATGITTRSIRIRISSTCEPPLDDQDRCSSRRPTKHPCEDVNDLPARTILAPGADHPYLQVDVPFPGSLAF